VKSCGRTSKLRVFRIRGVSPAIALTTGSRRDVHAAGGYIGELASHPLHASLYPRGARPAAFRACERTIARTGRLVSPPGVAVPTLRVTGARADLVLAFHDRSDVAGFVRAGVPYLHTGDLLQVSGALCRAPDGGRRFVVDRLRPAA
jgi:hypothetical protein